MESKDKAIWALKLVKQYIGIKRQEREAQTECTIFFVVP